MAITKPFNLNQWIDENRHLLADANLKHICNENVEWHNAIVHLLYKISKMGIFS